MRNKKKYKVIIACMLTMLTVLPLSGCSMQEARALFDNQDGTSFFKFNNPFDNVPQDPDLSTGADKKAGKDSTGVGSGSAKKSQEQKNNTSYGY